MEILDYNILVKPLNPPIGEMKYFAVIQFVSVQTEQEKKHIDPNLGEAHGISEDDAYKKMDERYKEWLNSVSKT